MTQPNAEGSAAPPQIAAASEPVGDSAPPDPRARLERLDEGAVTLWRLGYLLRGAIFTAVAAIGEGFIEDPLPAGLLAFVLAVITLFIAVVVPPARYRAWGYRLRDSDLYLRHGILIRTTSIVPHVRIQHVDTRHGPVDRYLGLADVVVYTAGTRGAIITIPALSADTAESLRDRLVALSGAGDAV